jgi:hypothetical protein
MGPRKFRRRRTGVVAYQWFPDKKIPGVVEEQPLETSPEYPVGESTQIVSVTGYPLTVRRGDWIIFQGYHPLCVASPEIFAAEYEHFVSSLYYRKTSIVEAIEFDGSTDSASELSVLYASNVYPEFGSDEATHTTWTGRMVIESPDRRYAVAGDWIVTDANGERYALNRQVFLETYEPAEV